jgi:hypothetical protein
VTRFSGDHLIDHPPVLSSNIRAGALLTTLLPDIFRLLIGLRPYGIRLQGRKLGLISNAPPCQRFAETLAGKA